MRGAVTTSLELVTQANGLLRNLQFSQAEQCLRKAIALEPRSVPALIGLGRLALLDRRPADALLSLDQALSLQPDCAEALALKGICWMQQNELERAIDILEQAKAGDPDLVMVYFNLGKSYCTLGQFAPAEQNLLKAIAMNPKHVQAYTQLSNIQAQTGRLRDSIHSMLQAIRINPHYALRERLCSLYALNRDFASAFQEALQIATTRKLYTDYLRLGGYAVALQQFETAEKAFETSIHLNPASWEGHYNLGELYMSARLMAQAREQYQAAIDNNHGGYEPLNGMGLFVLVVDHDCDRAIGLLNQALEIAPSRPEPRLNLALGYAVKRDFSAARKLAASVLNLTEPGDPFYAQAERLQGAIRIESHTLQALR
jgi:tetratricopeptide (TPR) repeat protein